MPRGQSLVPQQRSAPVNKDALPAELKLSLFEYPAEVRLAAVAAANAAGDDSQNGMAASGSDIAGSPPAVSKASSSKYGVGSPLVRNASALLASAGRPMSTNYGSTFFSPTGRQASSAVEAPVQVRVFDDEGNLTTRQTGVHSFHLRRETLFFVLRSLSWTNLIGVSALFYLFILFCITSLYYVFGRHCGARSTTTVVNSFYFTVVSLAANGGYMGEDPSTMGNPNSWCYTGRSMLVMVCSYANIIFVGLVAALVVGKAEYTGALANRIEFSDFCTLVQVPGRIDQWRLAFRMANLENQKPLAHGNLRLFVVSAEPLKQYRKQKRERKSMRQKLEAIHWDSVQQLHGRQGDSSAHSPGGAASRTEPLTAETLERKKKGSASTGGGGVTNASFSPALLEDPMTRAVVHHKRHVARERTRQKEERKRERHRARRAERQGEKEEKGSPHYHRHRLHRDRTASRHASSHDGEDGSTADARKESRVQKPKTAGSPLPSAEPAPADEPSVERERKEVVEVVVAETRVAAAARGHGGRRRGRDREPASPREGSPRQSPAGDPLAAPQRRRGSGRQAGAPSPSSGGVHTHHTHRRDTERRKNSHSRSSHSPVERGGRQPLRSRGSMAELSASASANNLSRASRSRSSSSSPPTSSRSSSSASSSSSSASSDSSESSSSSVTSTASSERFSARTNTSLSDTDVRSPNFARISSFHDLSKTGSPQRKASNSPNSSGHASVTAVAPSSERARLLGSPIGKSLGAAPRRTAVPHYASANNGSSFATRTESAVANAAMVAAATAVAEKSSSPGLAAAVSDDDDDDDADLLERVHINVSELRWTSPGEGYLTKESGQLLLWYPATITHVIDERSPLYRFMEVPRIGAALGLLGGAAPLPGVGVGNERSSTALSSKQFQIVAVFDATEMETGATIMAKHTYTTTDIVTHYKFSNKLVHMNPESSEILLDYHYFNDLLPMMAVESSTTDSDTSFEQSK